MKLVEENLRADKALFDFKRSIPMPDAQKHNIFAITNTRVYVGINVARVPIMEAIFWRKW